MNKTAVAAILVILAACTAQPTGRLNASATAENVRTLTSAPETSTATTGPAQVESATTTLTLTSIASVSLTLSTATNTPTPTGPQVCSPLQDIALSELASILTTPFTLPTPGRDNGHPGVDFAYYHHGSHTVMLGLPVYASLAGKVAAVIQDRPPYGNMIIIETPLSNLAPEFLASLKLSLQPTPAAIDNRLTCPTPAATAVWMPDPSAVPSFPDDYSLYLLYAHLNKPPSLALGAPAACGQPIGEVGTTGNSVNPHLHLETRLGPAGASFDTLAHYINNATPEEMNSYCTWRVSGMFQPFDPMTLFTLPNR